MVYCRLETPLGPMLAAASNSAITGLWFVGQNHFPRVPDDWQHEQDTALFNDLGLQLDSYFKGRLSVFSLPLALEGTPFRREIWSLLQDIPPGMTTTYGALAHRLSDKKGGVIVSARAVGGAVGHNPIAILVPCHRVVGADGSLTGYAGGLIRKKALLDLERSQSN
ncbi:MAG: methylated-DNA--[protein]-cysteine S-methyltransferase [Pseudomonadota bacterium]